MIVHVVCFNAQHTTGPHSFCLPSVEDLAFLVRIHSMHPPKLSMGSTYLPHLNDPFLRELDNLRVQASLDEELVACHIDLTNAFWSLVLPKALQGTFRVQIDGQIYGFSCLPFGWQFSPLICQYVLGFILESVHLDSSLVLQYIDDFLVVGYGKHRVRTAAGALSEALRKVGAIISIKSELELCVRSHGWASTWFSLVPMQGFFLRGRGGLPWLASRSRRQCCPSLKSMRDVSWGGMFGLYDPMQVMHHFYQGGGPIASGVLTGCKTAPSPCLPASCTASSCLWGVGHQNSCCLCPFVAGVLCLSTLHLMWTYSK